MSCLVVGASAGLGRSLAEALARSGQSLVLAASDPRDLTAQAADLRLRFGVDVETVAADAGRPGPFVATLSDALAGRPLRSVLFPIGATLSTDDGMNDTVDADRLLSVNFLSIAALVARLWPLLQHQSRASLVGFGSVAATRGRRGNVIYSAAKRALASYFESMRLAGGERGVVVQFYVLGYLDTQQTFGRRLLPPPAGTARLSARVVRDLGRDFGVRYYPAYWRPLCSALRLLPWPAFRRLRL